MDTNKEAAQSLIIRALQSPKQSEAMLLIDAAQRLDPEKDGRAIKAAWLEIWLIANQNRNGEK